MPPLPTSHAASPSAFAVALYRWRWPFSALFLVLITFFTNAGMTRLARFSSSVAGLGGDRQAAENAPPLVFDPSMDLWFGEEDSAVRTYYELENRFVAEDYVMVTLEEPDHELGVFSREALGTVARLTRELLRVPGVRHVRSLTYNPWIRWGEIEDEDGNEAGLIISDLVEGDPAQLSDRQILERMIAILGAQRTAQRVGEQRVREFLGADARFEDHLGEPLLLGMILNEAADTTVIQVQVLRPRVDAERLAAAFGEDKDALRVAPTLYSVATQRKSLTGIEHILRVEQGLAIPTDAFKGELARIAALDEGEAKQAAQFELLDPRSNLITGPAGPMTGPAGEPLFKFHEYERVDGAYLDMANGQPAAPGFLPKARSPFSYRIGGTPLFERNFERVGMADSKYVPLMFLVIVLMLVAVFRHPAGVIIPLVVVFGSILAMVGVNFARGDLMNNLTMMSPNMLTAVGIADAIHLVTSWAALRGRYDNKRDLITEVMSRNALPVFLTSLTTAVGFYSLTVSRLVPVQMLGVMTSYGTLVAYLLSMSLVPALLSLVPHRTRTQEYRSNAAEFFTRERSQSLIRGVMAQRSKILFGTACLFVISIVGVARVEIDSDFRGMFPDSNPTMEAYRWIESRMGGVGGLELVFSGSRGGEAGALATPLTQEQEETLTALQLREFGAALEPTDLTILDAAEEAQLAELEAQFSAWNASRIGVSTAFLEQLSEFERRLRSEMAEPGSALSIVTDFISPLDTLRKIHQVQNENSAAAYRVPREADVAEELRAPRLSFDEWDEEWTLTPGQNGSNLVAQYYLQYESGARPGESLTTQLSADRTSFRVQGRIQQGTSNEQLAAIERIGKVAREEFPAIAGDRGSPSPERGQLANLTISGKTLLFARTSQMFATGFLQSMGVALCAITLLIGIVFRSLRLALISLIPNLLPILLPLSAFGLLGVPLDGPSILVSSVALGVCVDDTIHMFTKYVRGRRAGRCPEDALVNTMHESGVAMSATTLVLVIGFSTLLLSDFSPNFQMGALASVMIGLAWLFDFVVTSAVLSYASAYALPATRSARVPAVPIP